MKKRGLSLKDVAARAGVSVATASRALKGHPALSASTIARVRQAAKECGYKTNPMVSAVMRRMRGAFGPSSLGAIGYLTFERTVSEWRKYPTYRKFHEGAVAGAQAYGFRVDEIWVEPQVMTAARLTQILRTRAITGIVIGPTIGVPQLPEIDWKGFAVVKIGVPFAEKTVSSVSHNHARGIMLALEELAKGGYRRPGLVLESHQSLKLGEAWLSAFVGWQQHQAADRRVPPLIVGKLTEDVFRPWFKAHRPDIVIGLRQETIAWLERLKQKVPLTAGFAHLDRPFDRKSIGGVDQHPFGIGKAAVELLMNQLLANEHGLPPLAHTLLIDGSWHPGATAAARA